MDSVLCYASQQWAYFTTQTLDKQLGDNWTDNPWWNAGPPYLHRHYSPDDKLDKWDVSRVAYDGSWSLPYSPYPDMRHAPTVASINNGNNIPWLIAGGGWEKEVRIMPATTLGSFCELLRTRGCFAYIPVQ